MADFLKMVQSSARFAKPTKAAVAATAIADGSAAWAKAETAKLQTKIKKLKAAEVKNKLDFFNQNTQTATADASSEESDPDHVLDASSDNEVGDGPRKRRAGAAVSVLDDAAPLAAPTLTLKQLQAKHDIHVSGSDVPRLVESFAAMERRLGVPRYLLSNLVAPLDRGGFGFAVPTPIQMQAVPAVLARRELLAFAPTGSGKTVAFALPMLALLDQTPQRHELEGTKWRRVRAAAAAGPTGAGATASDDDGDNDNDDDDDDLEEDEDEQDDSEAAQKAAKLAKQSKQAKLNKADAGAPQQQQGLGSSKAAAKAARLARAQTAAAKRGNVVPVGPRFLLPFRGVVMAPTRELAHQIFRVLQTLTRAPNAAADDRTPAPAAAAAPWRVVDLTEGVERAIKASAVAAATDRMKQFRAAIQAAGGGTAAGKRERAAPHVLDFAEFADEESDEEESADAVEIAGRLNRAQMRSVHPGADAAAAAEGESAQAMFRQIVVATPLRLLQLMADGHCELALATVIVFDEADRLFDLGMSEQMSRVLARCTHPRATRVLCSATVTAGVEALARSVLRDPVRVIVGGQNVAQALVTQRLVYVGSQDGKDLEMKRMIREGLNVPMLVFVQSKERAMQLYDELRPFPIRCEAIHGDKSQAERQHIMDLFRRGRCWVLICTDLMARGIDFKHVNCVVNYDFPQTTSSYIHRIGRTGRAGRAGEAVTFVAEEDKTLLHHIAHIVHDSTVAQSVGKYGQGADYDSHIPQWMLDLPKASARAVRRLAEEAPVREAINREHAKERREKKNLKRTEAAKHAKHALVQSRGESGRAKVFKTKQPMSNNKRKKLKNKHISLARRAQNKGDE